MNSGFSSLASSAVLRGQQFLIRSLGGYSVSDITHQKKRMEAVKCSSGGASLEADAECVLRAITPSLDPRRHKGQAGNIAVIGGCREYTGAPYFVAISALKIGADLSHVFCTQGAATVIKSYSPELIVHPILEESYTISDVDDEGRRQITKKIISEFDKWIERFDCLVIGPGLGRDPFLLECVSKLMTRARESNVPMVVDADGLFLVTNNIELVMPLLVRIGGVTILRKRKSDLISDGEIVQSVSIYGSPRRCGGQGDILSGSVAVFLSWARQHISETEREKTLSRTSPIVLGCIAGSALLRKAAALAFEHKKRSTLTTDIIEHLGQSLESICPAS
ncbi:ATP-dependent (S)-NAD(P)H-hydrate dehydratase [Hibiscus syriacus]|uniref:ATP-dependent (S)-NAD(P)H-hydrate dehydratase n=1 Tax=Hibiscus syriacus TaxID=106335 RepID=A0A6A3BGM3_HIBSY|nr:ATP-dependent (S)-NAD(P)H-hydrate dehydratase [Hibiscus syriacus]